MRLRLATCFRIAWRFEDYQQSYVPATAVLVDGPQADGTILESLGVLAIVHNTTGENEPGGREKHLDFVNNTCCVADQHEATCAHAQKYTLSVCIYTLGACAVTHQAWKWSARVFQTLAINYVQRVKLHLMWYVIDDAGRYLSEYVWV